MSQPPSAQFAQMGFGPVMKIELRMQCTNLVNKDVSSKSDPMLVLEMKNDQQKWYEVGRTENIKNDLNPQFTKTFELDYFFEEVQKLRFSVYDTDNKTVSLHDDDFLGRMKTTLGAIVSKTPYEQPLLSKKGKSPIKDSKIKVSAEEVGGPNESLIMQWRGKKLDKKDFLGKSDPFLEFLRLSTSNNYEVVHRTEVIQDTLNPTWMPIKIPLRTLAMGDNDREILVRCFDEDADGSHDLIGQIITMPCELLDIATNKSSKEFQCINPKKKEKKKYTNSGIIELVSCKLVRDYSFLDYIFGGLQLNFTVGFDFTASNGNPQDPNSLHYINPHQPNEYMLATMAVGNVVQDYDTDKMFPVLGFGARLPPSWQLSHEFAVNFNPTYPFCAGVQGILDAYRNCVAQVQLYGPTNVAPIINHIANFASQAAAQRNASQYYILLLLTDGAITDMDETTCAIVNASRLPMSIIIVGVGPADFTAMNFLDSDIGPLKTPYGQQALRDIVQFVPFRKFASASKERLAKEVLAEVPKQVTDYFMKLGIQPLNQQPSPS